MSFITENLIGRDFESFYAHTLAWDFPRAGGTNKLLRCGFHADSKPSMSVNIEDSRYHCFSCGASGDAVTALVQLLRVDEIGAIEELRKYFGVEATSRGPVAARRPAPARTPEPPPEPRSADELANVERWHLNLLDNDERMAWLLEKRGLVAETVVRFKLGYTGDYAEYPNRYSIPIFDAAGALLGTRLYHWDRSIEAPKFAWASRGTKVGLYPVQTVATPGVLVCEGELDALLAIQNGFPAVTSTGGASAWKADWAAAFDGCNVAIAYDRDKAGEEGAAKVAAALRGHAAKVRIVVLPVDKVGGDLTDWFVDGDGNAQALRALIEATPVVTEPGSERKLAAGGETLADRLALVQRRKDLNLDERGRVTYQMIYDHLVKAGRFFVDAGISSAIEDAVYYFSNATKELHAVRAPEFDAIINDATAINPAKSLFNEIKTDLHMRAVRDLGNRVRIHDFAFYSKELKRCYIYRGNNRMWVLDGGPVREEDNGHDGVLFRRPEKPDVVTADFSYRDTGALPLLEIFEDLNLVDGEITAEDQKLLLLIHVILMLFPELEPTRLIAVLCGEQGSGKTFTAKRIGQLMCGPEWSPTIMDASKEDDFSLLLTRRFVVCADNVDNKIPWIHDTLACAATGAEVARRKLYSDNLFVSAKASAFLFLTTREPRWLKRDDVVQRCLPITFLPRAQEFGDEGQLLQKELSLRPIRIAHLLDIANATVRLLAQRGVSMQTSPLRIADYAINGELVAQALGLRERFVEAVSRLPKEQRKFLTSDHPLIEELQEWLAQGNFDVAIEASELYRKLAEQGGWNHSHGIRSTRGMVKRIEDLQVEVERYVGPYEMKRDGPSGKVFLRFSKSRETLDVEPSTLDGGRLF